ncbi:hypothetical protein, partial [Ursidibacter sp. B-7004-1]
HYKCLNALFSNHSVHYTFYLLHTIFKNISSFTLSLIFLSVHSAEYAFEFKLISAIKRQSNHLDYRFVKNFAIYLKRGLHFFFFLELESFLYLIFYKGNLSDYPVLNTQQ